MLDLLLGLLEFPPGDLARCSALLDVAAPDLVEAVDKGGESVGLHQFGGERAKDDHFEGGPAECLGIAAAAVAGRNAAEIGAADQAERTVAEAAEGLAREQMVRPAAVPEAGLVRGRVGVGREGLGLEPALGGLPQGIVDDSQLRHLRLDYITELVGPPELLTGDRVGDGAPPVPDQFADIDTVAEDAVLPGRPAADRGMVPGTAGGAGDALGVQASGNRQRAEPGDVVAEDVQHDGRLLRVDFAQTAVRLSVRAGLAHDAVTIGRVTDAAALEDAPGFTAPCFVCEVSEVGRAKDAANPDMELPDCAIGKGDDLHAQEGTHLIEGRDMFRVAGYAIQAFGQDEVGLACLEVAQHRLIARPQQGSTRDRCIGVRGHDGPAFPLGARVADALLVLNRGGALTVRRVSCIGQNANGHGQPLGREGERSRPV